MNAYGFASGDRINFSDPFGLKQCPPDCGGLGSLLGVFAASGVPATAPNGPPIMRIGVTGSLGSLSGSCKLGGSCGGAVNLTPQFGASIDVAIPYRSAGANEWGGSVGYGVNKHLGVSFSNEEFGASLGLGVGAPVSISVTPPSSPAANPEGVPTVRPDVTAVRRKPPSL